VSTQRKKREALSTERIAALEAAPGLDVAARRTRGLPPLVDKRAANWQTRLDELVMFRARQHHWPALTATGSERLITGWLGRQTRSYLASSLSMSRTAALEATDGWRWPEHSTTWCVELG
jgi:hypothetical protein